MTTHILKTWLSYSWEEAMVKYENGIYLDDIVKLPLIMPSASSNLYKTITNYCQKKKIEITSVCEARNAPSALDMCIAGIGAIFLNEDLLLMLKGNPAFWGRHQLIAFPIAGPLSTMDIMLVYRNDGTLSREYQNIVDLSLQRAKDRASGKFDPAALGSRRVVKEDSET